MCIGGRLPEPRLIPSGVLQGNILGPIMFLLFINDLPLELKNDIGIYADNATLYASGSTLNEVEEKLKNDPEEASKWAKKNKIRIHQSKTRYNIICIPKKLANSSKQITNLSLENNKLSEVESERVLGVHIDSHLSWSVHIEELHRKLVKRISVLARVRKYLPTDIPVITQASNRCFGIAVLSGVTAIKAT